MSRWELNPDLIVAAAAGAALTRNANVDVLTRARVRAEVSVGKARQL
jgi:hypothetical protein